MALASLNRFRLRRRAMQAPVSLKDLAGAKSYPVLDAGALIRLTGTAGKISTIKQLASLSPEQFEQLYIPAIHRFVEAAQLQPGSANDHHSGLGGLVIHTLDVVVRAMMQRRRYQMPRDAEPERVAREDVDWTYGVFAGALLHDAGKLITLFRIVPDAPGRYSPLGGSLLESGAASYRLVFVDNPSAGYEFQQRSSLAAFHYLPPAGLDRLTCNIPLLTQLTAYLGNTDPYEWGLLGEVCHHADRASVANDLMPGVSRERLPGVPTKSLAERLMQAIRAEIAEGGLPLNKNGAAGWVDQDGSLWLVCKRAIERSRNRLVQLGATDVPGPDYDVRLFAMLCDHDYAIRTPKGDAVWLTRVSGEGYAHNFTMLRFDASRAVLANRRIAFPGVVRVFPDNASYNAARDEPSSASTDADGDRPDQAELASCAGQGDALMSKDPPYPTEKVPFEHEEPAATEILDTSAVEDVAEPLFEMQVTNQRRKASTGESSAEGASDGPTDSIGESPDSSAGASTFPGAPVMPLQALDLTAGSTDPFAPSFRGDDQLGDGVIDASTATVSSPREAAETVNRVVRRHPDEITTVALPASSPEIGRYFLSWVRASLSDGTLTFDSAGLTSSDVFILSDGVGITHGAVANQFIDMLGVPKGRRSERRNASRKLLASLSREGYLIMRGRRLTHQLLLPTPSLSRKRSFVSIVYVPAWTLFPPEDTPPVNRMAELRLGDYDPLDTPLNDPI